MKGKAFSYSPPLLYLSPLPPSLPPYSTIQLSLQFFSIFSATALSSFSFPPLLSESHSFSLHPVPSPLPFPLHLRHHAFQGELYYVLERGMLLLALIWGCRRHICRCYRWLCCSVYAQALQEQLAGKLDVRRTGPGENGASSSAEID